MDSKHGIDSGDETIIELSKTKLVLFLLGASAFVAVGIWMFLLDDASILAQRRPSDPMFVHGLGLAAIVFFGVIGLYVLKKLFDRRPALVFNDSGIIDNASGVSAGFIPWSEVLGAEIFEIQKQKLLVIMVRDPQEYIARGSSLRQKLNRANYRMVGSPISISANTLAIKFSELASLFDRYQRKYGAGPGVDDGRHQPFGRDVRSPVVAGHDWDSDESGAEPGSRLLDWSPGAVKGSVGSGGVGIFVLSASSLDMLFQIKVPFWPAFTVSLLPMLIFFLAVPDILPARVARPAQWFAAVLYLGLAGLSISLAAYRGLGGIEFLLAGFVLLGAWPCLVAIYKLVVFRET